MMETLVIRTTTIKFRLTRMELDCDKFECLQREPRHDKEGIPNSRAE